MFVKLVQSIIDLPEEQLAQVNLEEIAICATWYDSFRDDTSIRESYAMLRQTLDAWARCVQAPAMDTEGHRQQPLLRVLIQEVIQDRLGNLARGEVDFLYFTVGLARRSGQKELFSRPLECLDPHMNAITARREELELTPGLPALWDRLAVYVPSDITSAEAKDITLFAGIDYPIRGPVLTHTGNVKIFGSIPESGAVVVDEGNCYVRGDMLGALAATVDCEIEGNLSGLVISRRGHIRARSIINKATAIAKECSVSAVKIEGPKLIFGSQDISIRESMRGGHLIGNRITAGGDIEGGIIQASELVQCQVFRNTEEQPLSIVLRRGLHCQDYGEVLSADARLLMSSAMKLRQRLLNTEELMDITEREADDFAGNALIFILGEKDVSDNIRSLETKRQEVAFYERLEAGIHALAMASEDRVNLMSSASEEDLANFGREERSLLEDLRKELASLSNEGSVSVALHNEREEVMHLGRKLQSKTLSQQGILQVLDRLQEKCADIEERRKNLQLLADAEEVQAERAMGKAKILERAKAERSRFDLLNQLLRASRVRMASAEVKRRSSDRYVRLMQRIIENRMSRISGYRSTTRDLEDRVQQVRDKLWEQHRVSLPEHVMQGWSMDGAKAVGAFEEGVQICAWKHQIEGGSRSTAGVTFSSDTAGEKVSFARTARGGIEAL